MFGALLRIFSYGSMAVKGAKKARDAMSSEQAEAAKAIVKDPEGWGDSLSSGWDKVKEESFELKDAFLTLYRIQIGRRTTKKERKNASERRTRPGRAALLTTLDPDLEDGSRAPLPAGPGPMRPTGQKGTTSRDPLSMN